MIEVDSIACRGAKSVDQRGAIGDDKSPQQGEDGYFGYIYNECHVQH